MKKGATDQSTGGKGDKDEQEAIQQIIPQKEGQNTKPCEETYQKCRTNDPPK
jgi:hypothetical protein